MNYRPRIAAGIVAAVLLIQPLFGATIYVNLHQGSVYPALISISTEDTVIFISTGGIHSAADYGGAWQTPVMSNGMTFSYTFNKPGEYTYKTLWDLGLSSLKSDGIIIVKGWTNSPPAVSLVTPVEGFHFNVPDRIYFLASFTNSPSDVRSLEYLRNNNLLFAATNAPFGAMLELGEIGAFEITVRVTDSQGRVTVSEPVHIFGVGPPVVYAPKKLPSGQFRFSYTQFYGYQSVERSDDLKNWRKIYVTPGDSGTFVDENSIGVTQAFYRTSPW